MKKIKYKSLRHDNNKNYECWLLVSDWQTDDNDRLCGLCPTHRKCSADRRTPPPVLGTG